MTTKSIEKILTCLLVLLVFCSFAQAQKTKTVTGYFCGSEPGGNAFSYSSIRVGNTIVEYTESLRQVKYVGMKKKNARKVGAEYVVQYERDDEGINWAKTVTFTGSLRKIEPCN